jgi:hypothetical protein
MRAVPGVCQGHGSRPCRRGRRPYVSRMRALVGRFRVRRLSGLLPPFGVTKRIDGSKGMTCLFGVPIGAFRVIGRRFVYKWWPIVDEIDGEDERGWVGRGRLFGVVTFCRFRLERL